MFSGIQRLLKTALFTIALGFPIAHINAETQAPTKPTGKAVGTGSSKSTNKNAFTKRVQVAQAFASSLQDRDYNALADIFDFEAFALRTAKTVSDSERDIKSFQKGFLSNKETVFLKNYFSGYENSNIDSINYLRLNPKNKPDE